MLFVAMGPSRGCPPLLLKLASCRWSDRCERSTTVAASYLKVRLYFFSYQSSSHVLTGERTVGGHIGFYCSHAYPHTSDDAVILPDMLKGVDMVVMEALRRLNVEATIKPVLEIEKYREENEMVIGRGPTRRDENLGSCQMEDGIEDLVDDWRNGETLDVDQVHWIGQPLHKQIQVSYIAVS